MNKKSLVVVILIFLLCLAIAGYKLYQQKKNNLIYTGTVEVTKVDITTKTSGYLDFLKLDEGQIIKKGELTAKVGRDDLQMQLVRDEMAWQKAEIQLRDLVKGARSQELKKAAASVASFTSVFNKTNADYQRYHALYNDNAISKQALDEAKSAYEVARENLEAAKEEEKLLIEGNRSDVILAQKLEVKRCKAVLAGTKISCRDCEIYSPITGMVLTKNYEQGEYVNIGSALGTLADLSDTWIRIYISAADLGKRKMGESAAIMVDAYPQQTFKGRIKEISEKAEFTPRQSITKDERTNMVFGVKIQIENNEGILKPGMPADVIFND